MVEESKNMIESSINKNKRVSISKVFWLSVIVSAIVVGVLFILMVVTEDASAVIKTENLMPTDDTYLYENIDNSYGTSSILYCYDKDNTRERRVLIKYDLNQLPNDAIITKATFTPFRYYGSFVYNNPTYDHTMYVHEITSSYDWIEGSSFIQGATWTYVDRGSSTRWNTPGGDINPTPVATKFVETNSYGKVCYQFEGYEVTNLVQDWWSGVKQNNGFMITYDGTNANGYQRYFSKEYTGTTWSCGYLSVTFTTNENYIDLIPSDDTYLQRNYNWGYPGRYDYLHCYDKDAATTYRPLLKWDLSYLPDNSQITKAEFNIWRYYGLQNSAIYAHTISIYRVTNTYDWREGGRNLDGATWNYVERETQTRWNTAGGDYDPTAITSKDYSIPKNSEYQTYDLTNEVQGWSDGSIMNNGILMIMDGARANNYGRYMSRSGVYAPYIRIYYKSAVGVVEIVPEPDVGKDNYLYHASNNAIYNDYNYGKSPYVYQYYYDYGTWYRNYRGLLQFTEENWDLLKGASIEEAYINIFFHYAYMFPQTSPYTFSIDVHKVKIPWDEGVKYSSSTADPPETGSCWQSSDNDGNPYSNVAWNGATDYYDPTPLYSLDLRVYTQKLVQVDIKDMLIDWMKNPDENYGLLFKCREKSGERNYAYFRSSDFGGVKVRPKIVIYCTYGDMPPVTEIDLKSKLERYHKTDEYTGWCAADGYYEIHAEDDEGLVETWYQIESSNTDSILVPWTKVEPTSGQNTLTIPLDMGDDPFNNREDTYSISYYSVDNLGQTEWTNITDITIDTTSPGKPLTDDIEFGTPFYQTVDRTWITPQTTIEIMNAIDYGGNGNPSGFSKGHGWWSNDKGNTWTKEDGQFKTSGEGDHQLWFRARDNVDNSNHSNYVHYNLTIDGTTPVTQTLTVGPVINGFISYLTEWLIPGATDYCGGGGTPCGVERTEYSVDQPGGPYTTITLNQKFTINMMQGPHTIYYRSVDFMGNIEPYKTMDVVVDNAPPPQSKLHYKDLIGAKWYDNTNLLIYVNANTEITLIAPKYDNPNKIGENVGYDYSEYSFSRGPYPTGWIRYTDTITIPESVLESLGDGQYDFSFRSVDKLGNTYTTVLEMETIYYQGEKKYSIVFDNNAPVTEAMTPTTNPESKGDWYYGSLYVTSEKKLYDSYATYFKMGESKDPIINNYGTGVKIVEWAVALPNTDTDDLIWIEWEDYETVNRAIKEYETAMYLMGELLDVTDGNWSIYYRGWDMLNNIEETKHLDITVDDSPPTSDYEILADGKALTDDELDYYSVGVDPNEFFADINFEYKLSSKDLPGDMWMNAGPKAIEYKILDENTGKYIHSWIEYQKPFKLPGDGKYVIFYRGVDNLNHHENELSFTIYVDMTGPSQPDIEVGVPTYIDLKTYYLWVNTKASTPFKLTNLKDPKPSKVTLASGVIKAEYKVDDGEWTDSFFDIFYPEGADGEHTIYARAIDKIGNEGEVQIKVLNTDDDILYGTVVFDSTPPITEITKFTVNAGDSGSVKLVWEVDDKNFDHLNIYRSSIENPSEWNYVDTVGKTVTKYTDIPDNEGSYKYKIAPADKVENEAEGRISTENIILASGRNREFQVPTNPGPYDPYVRVIMKTITTKATVSAELLDTLPSGVETPEGSDFTFWDINDGTDGGTRVALEAELYFYYGHLKLTSDMEDYMRVIYWDGHKWSDFAERNIDKINDEIMVTTTHFSIYGVVRAYSDIGVEISLKNNPNLAGRQNVIYAEVTNYGKAQGRLFDVDEEGVNVTFAVKNAEGGWTDLGYEEINILAGDTQTISMVWDDAEVTGRDGVDVEVRVIPKDSKTETDPDNNFATENVAIVESEFVVSSFVTNLVILVISTIVVVALSRKIMKNK